MNLARDFQYQFQLAKKNHWEMTCWCEQQFGPRWEAIGNRSGTWCTFWGGRGIPGYYRWYFLNEQDSVLFALKWL